jgi:hypothetical protein
MGDGFIMREHVARKQVSAIVRRAVLFHLSLAAPGLVACGHGSAGGVESAPCSVIPNTPPFNASGTCIELEWQFNGTATECGPNDGGMISLSTCEVLCPQVPTDAGLEFSGRPLSACFIGDCYDCGKGPTSYEQLECQYGCAAEGRRPAGLRPCPLADDARSPTARFLVRMAYLEAASVGAFERLARELAAYGGPEHLRRAALRAASDEERHARVATALAERAGAKVPRPRVPKGRVRSLEAIARENAVEGCVHETFGAAVAMAQSMTASDARIRAAMRKIGPDEMRHADLAWNVARWLDSRLDPAARARVVRARHGAAGALICNAAREVHPDLIAQLGLPTPPHARAIALDLAATLWGAA